MKQHNTTPYDEMMAFLINATCPILSNDHEWLCALHDRCDNFEELLHDEMSRLIALSINHGFFDSIKSPGIVVVKNPVDISGTIEEIKNLIEGGTQ